MWVEMLEAEEFDAFNEAGHLFDPTAAKRLWRHAYRGGNTRESAAVFRAVLGRDPQVTSMFRKRGLLLA